ncbi:XRE family transcriptional regulator [Photobacterium jeanii]|uniref:XRE family transcriptional regulator n=1 Tax=Photobacterium jeanii TaxID=858640 RepID=A0A178KH34_9GAMM|nr:sugar diacid recognition domain-containing protein [Photobacterium jeanii]OAN16598.1 XRE family transcriptional regulator [Photobacterium jeanii]PST87991.1 XRE family transcriptional regulator [Photobacterium jeanii]
MQLNATIARQIIERTMKIIPYSINVMNEQGRIIGSGDPARINQRHDGAILAINDNRVVEIDQATANQLKGVKPGINLPILFHQEVIGVIGISGVPEQVRSFGELVKMTAELIVEQAALMSQIQWDKRHREELVLQLIKGSELNENQLTNIAERLDLDLSQPRIAAVVKVLPTQGEQLSLEYLQRVVHLLEYPERNNLVGIVSVSHNEIVVLKPITLVNGEWLHSDELKRAQKLMKRAAKDGSFTLQIAMGGYFPTLDGLAKSYLTAQATLEANISDDSLLFYHDHLLPVLLSGLKHEAWRHEQLCAPLTKLRANDPRGILFKTLKTFFVQNCDLAQTCQQLHIHRNTLRYRLEKIEQETSLNFNNIADKTRLYLAVLNHS